MTPRLKISVVSLDACLAKLLEHSTEGMMLRDKYLDAVAALGSECWREYEDLLGKKQPQ